MPDHRALSIRSACAIAFPIMTATTAETTSAPTLIDTIGIAMSIYSGFSSVAVAPSMGPVWGSSAWTVRKSARGMMSG
jgi:hypothetical protein